MLWIIIAVIAIVLGIIITKENENWGGFVLSVIIAIVFLVIMIANNSYLYSVQFWNVKGYEVLIPAKEVELAFLEKNAITAPENSAEFQISAMEQEEIEKLKANITADKIRYFQKIHRLRLRNPWTNIFVLIKGRFEDQPVDFNAPAPTSMK